MNRKHRDDGRGSISMTFAAGVALDSLPSNEVELERLRLLCERIVKREKLKASISLECAETVGSELKRRIGQQLDEASVADLLLRAPTNVITIYDIGIVHELVQQFMLQKRSGQSDLPWFTLFTIEVYTLMLLSIQEKIREDLKEEKASV